MSTLETNPCTLPAFVGHKIDPKTGELFWKVCAWCPSKSAVDAEAARLCVRVTHTMCGACYFRETGKRMGEQN